MGMFDKDKEIGLLLTDLIPQGEPFILWNARVIREDFPTSLGATPQTGLKVSRTADPSDQFTVTTLASSIASKVREAVPGDFPAVVTWTKVPTKYGQDATVLRFLKPYDANQRRTTPTESEVRMSQTLDEAVTSGAVSTTAADDDLPF